MNKYEERWMYDQLSGQLSDEVSLSPQRRVLQTRLLKISLPIPNYVYGEIGMELFESGQFQKSIPWLKRATIFTPHDSSAQISLAKAFFILEKEDKAFSSIKKSLSLNPYNSELHKFFFEILEEKNRLEDLESLSKEIRDIIADPDSIPFFYFGSAGAFVNCGKYSQAVVMFRKAMENDPPTVYDHHFNYGLALYYEGLFEEAIVQFEHAQMLIPDEKMALNNIAHLNYCLGRVEKAREEFEFIIANGKEMNLTHLNFLLVLYHLDEDEESMNECKDGFEPYFASSGSAMPKVYNDQLRITQKILEKDDIDEETRKFNIKKLEGINFVLSFINERNAQNDEI